MNEQHEQTTPQESAGSGTPPAAPGSPTQDGERENAAPAAQPKRYTLTTATMTSATDADVERQMRRMSRRGFLWGAAAAATGFTGWRWLVTRHDDDSIPWPFRRMLEINEHLSRDYFRPARLSPTFPRAMAGEPRQNGDVGLSEDFDPATWQLRVEGVAKMSEPLFLTLDDILAFPRTDVVTELRCIEG